MNASVRAPRLQSKLLGAVSVGLAVVLLCALAGLASAWLKLSTDVPPEVAHSRDAERLQREFRGQVQEWKNVLLRGHDDALRQRHLEAFDSEGRLVEQLAEGGRLVAPVGGPGAQSLVQLDRKADGSIEQRVLAPVTFVPLLSGMLD